MKLWINLLLRLAAGTYFVVTSLYCILAFLPYTFFFLVKAPPYAWMPWFVRHQAALYWTAAAAALISNWNIRDSWRAKDRTFIIGIGTIIAAGIYLSFRAFLPTLDDTRPAYWWSLVALLPLVAIGLWRCKDRVTPDQDSAVDKPFAYSVAVIAALVIGAIYFAGARVHVYIENRSLALHAAEVELTFWTLVSHCALAILVLSVINLIFLLTLRMRKAREGRRAAMCALAWIALWVALYRFLEGALSFRGWDAQLYAASLALAITLWGFALVAPFLALRNSVLSRLPVGSWAALAASTILAIAFPYLIGGADWSGFLEGIVTFVVWIAICISTFRLYPARRDYSVATVIVVLVLSAVAYKGFEASEIFWSQPLGSTDDEISLALEAYAGHDASFQLAHHILGSGRSEVCGDLCRILREYTNVRDTRARTDVRLVEKISTLPDPAPNIFIFVIDSMRPDYLGAYNPRVNYTPNLDAFARDSIVFHRAFTQYAGTSLSEPAIWSGAMMLHAHYVQPFSRLNSLDRLVHAGHYRTLVSMDEVLSLILPAHEVDVRLDTEKKLWNQLELGSTLRQAENALDDRRNATQPVFFYAQPKNVHQFAQNDVPSPTSQHWQSPAGLNARITYEVNWVDARLGEFFAYLKQRGLYDDSIIIVTSDHGDATGEFGRMSHSTSIWPEIMSVPLMVHLPARMGQHLVCDDSRISTLTDITPTLYSLLGQRPIIKNPMYGRPLFAETKEELDRYQPKDLLLASDVRAVYGILTADGRYLYTTYDSPSQSYLFDLRNDPDAEHSFLTPALKQRYDQEIIEHLQLVGDFYGYKPGVGSLLASAH